MKKLIIGLISAILLTILGIAGLNQMKSNGPRTRVISPTGSKIIVEEMSYYIRGEKYFGKVFKPAGENQDSLSTPSQLPALIYFHEPLKIEWPEKLLKSLVPDGVIGYACGFRAGEKEALETIKRLRGENFIQSDMVFIISDSSCGNEVVKAVSKLGHKIQGLILIEPSLTGKARETYVRYGREFLTIPESSKGNAVSMIEEYLEERGALK